MISSLSGYGAYGSTATSLYPGARQRPDRAEMQEKLFSKLDSSGDGSIDESELSSLLTRGGSTDSGVDAASALSDMDSDGDGSLSSEEFNAGAEKLLEQLRSQSSFAAGGFAPQPPSAEDMATQLMEADGDGDGAISESELGSALASLQGADGSATDLTELFARIDADGDGSITGEEALADAEALLASGPGGGMGGMQGMMPPPPPPQDSSTSSSSSTRSSTGSSSDARYPAWSSLLTQYGGGSASTGNTSALLERMYGALGA